MKGFALFRMPYARECTMMAGAVREYPSLSSLSGQQGFVVAPFAVSDEEPVLLIQPDETGGVFPDLPLQPIGDFCSSDRRADYHIDFCNFHSHLLNGDFQKLVLSRSLDIASAEQTTPVELFRRACDSYPRMFISLVYTPQSGLWLASTPETLLSGEGDQWQTMALAGTVAWQDHVAWGDKNLQEQRYVATYITRQLELFTSDFTENGPYTARAGHLAHLRSDFRFTLNDRASVGELLRVLHPTPAVCGLPKEKAFRFILDNEHHGRSYYSGFMGPFGLRGQTHLFVTLRCMQLFRDAYRLYAGGGLLTDSDEEQEWQETETKLDTMRRILKTQ